MGSLNIARDERGDVRHQEKPIAKELNLDARMSLDSAFLGSLSVDPKILIKGVGRIEILVRARI